VVLKRSLVLGCLSWFAARFGFGEAGQGKIIGLTATPL